MFGDESSITVLGTFGIETQHLIMSDSAVTWRTDTALQEKGVIKSISGSNAPALKEGDVIIKVDERYFRPSEVETLLGDPSKAKNKLGWVPEVTIQEMCAEMVKEDLKLAKKAQLLKDNGYDISVSSET